MKNIPSAISKNTFANQISSLQSSKSFSRHILEKNIEKEKRYVCDKMRLNSLVQPWVNTEKKTILHIKNMVCTRCKIIVEYILENLKLPYTYVELGEVEIACNIPNHMHEILEVSLLKYGLELIENKKNILVEKVRKLIIDMIHFSDELPKIKVSNYLSETLNHEYNYLSNLFIEVQGITIQQFIILQKIEKVKELLFYGELRISEISWKMGYSSVAHLSYQFKNVTGKTPRQYTSLKDKMRLAIDSI